VFCLTANARKINEGGISSDALSLTDKINIMLHRLMNATLPLSFNLFVIGSIKNFLSDGR
jgi:hypothetical protein